MPHVKSAKTTQAIDRVLMGSGRRWNFILAVAVSLVVVLFEMETINDRRDAAVRSANEAATHLASAAAERVRSEVGTVLVAMSAIKNAMIDAEGVSPLAERLVHDLGPRNPSVRTVIVANADGIVVVDSRPGGKALGVDVSDREYFIVQKDGGHDGAFVGPAVESRADGHWVPPISIGVRAADGRFLGVVAAAVDPVVWSELVSVSPGLFGFMLRIVHGDAVLAVAPRDSEGHTHPKDTKTNSDIETFKSEIHQTQTLRDLPLSIEVVDRLENRLQGVREFERQSLFAAGLILILVWGLAIVSSVLQRRFKIAAVAATDHRNELADINEQLKKEMSERVRAQSAAESANQAKTRFLQTVSHELRTPLNTVIGYSEVISRQMFGPLENERYREYVKNINESGQYLLKLVEDILDLSKIESGQRTLDMALVSVSSVAADAVDVAGLKEHDRIAVSVPGDLRVLADSHALTQVLVNLLANAKTHAADAETITVSASDLGAEVSIEVADDGAGMDETTLQRINHPFERGPGDTMCAPATPGSGIGLNIVRGLVVRMNGTFVVKSRPNGGTTATIRLQKATSN